MTTANVGRWISLRMSRPVDPKQRFSNRVSDYVRFRPSYPPEVVETLSAECGLGRESVVADVGAGTGIFTRLLLEHGCRVFGIEPNDEMRGAAEESLAQYANVVVVKGTAEATQLPDHSVDCVVCAQSAHWFDRRQAASEFDRILKPGGWLVILWNQRLTGPTPFLMAYEELLLTYGTDYQTVRHDRQHSAVHEFFDPFPFRERQFGMAQELNYEALVGRLLSSSYTPQPNQANYRPMLDRLRQIFLSCQRNGKVELEYRTRMYYGSLG